MGLMSMTGFGSGKATLRRRSYRVDVKSVNHKNLAVRLSLPAELARAEHAAKELIRQRLVRGAIDVTVRVEVAGSEPPEVKVDRAAAIELMRALQDLATHCGTGSPTLELVLRYGNVIEVVDREIPAEEAESMLLAGLGEALDGLLEMRAAEGDALGADLNARLDTLDALLAEVEQAAPAVLAALEEKLQQRVKQAEAKLGVEIDAGRIAAELVVFSDRSDVTEEVVRARTHITRFREALTADGDGERGKRLDFLSQELLREFNTMGSKCRDVEIAGQVIEAKVELEKIREQAQNIA
ncbi:MAG: YicC family protein [Deltaproteobacteria bacterium]|nr:MAG: YicC family protein [Deltaproteobacteria bacterium]